MKVGTANAALLCWLLGIASWRRKGGATAAPPLTNLFALLGRHLLPTLVHALLYSLPHIRARAMTTVTTPASEQNPAESEQAAGLPEGDLPPSEERRQQPAPEMLHQFAANPDEKR